MSNQSNKGTFSLNEKQPNDFRLKVRQKVIDEQAAFHPKLQQYNKVDFGLNLSPNYAITSIKNKNATYNIAMFDLDLNMAFGLYPQKITPEICEDLEETLPIVRLSADYDKNGRLTDRYVMLGCVSYDKATRSFPKY